MCTCVRADVNYAVVLMIGSCFRTPAVILVNNMAYGGIMLNNGWLDVCVCVRACVCTCVSAFNIFTLYCLRRI